jgi:hypothetical protein
MSVCLKNENYSSNSDAIRPHKDGTIGDRGVDMTLRGEVNDGIDR